MSLIRVLGIFLLHNFFHHESYLCILLSSNFFPDFLLLCHRLTSKISEVFVFYSRIKSLTSPRCFLHLCTLIYESSVTNFIQLVSPQPVDQFLQTKLHCKAPNEGYLHICWMYKSNNKQLRYQVISNCKIFVC